jgi:hypothetical protein
MKSFNEHIGGKISDALLTEEKTGKNLHLE